MNCDILYIKSDFTGNKKSLALVDNLDKNLAENMLSNENNVPELIVNNIDVMESNETSVSTIENDSNNVIKIENTASLNLETENLGDEEAVKKIGEDLAENIALEENKIAAEMVVDNADNINTQKNDEEFDFSENPPDVNKNVKMVENSNQETALAVNIPENSPNEMVMDNENNKNLPVSEPIDNPSINLKEDETKDTAEIAVDNSENIITISEVSENSLNINKDVCVLENTDQETALAVIIPENSPNEIVTDKENNENLPTSEATVDNPSTVLMEEEIVLDFPKVTINTELLSTISEEIQSLTSTWTKRDFTKSHCLVNLDQSTFEYIDVRNIFMRFCRTFYVTKIERVENPFLLAQYLLKKAKLTKELGYVEERKMFHATKLSNVENICFKNFNWRLCGRARGHKFGQGVSFSPDSFYSTWYTKSNLMFLVNVLVGKSHMGAQTRLVPMDGYDTTNNSKETVFVKYEDDDFYPNYVIHYQKC